MARTLDGTSNYLDVGFNLSVTHLVDLSVWAYFTAWPAAFASMLTWDNAAGSGHDSFYLCPTDSGGNSLLQMIFSDASGHTWRDSFPRPTLNAWHHYLAIFDMGLLTNTLYVDGVLQTASHPSHVAGTYTNFKSNTLWMGCDGTPPGNLPAPCRMAEVALWNGIGNVAGVAAALAAGAIPLAVQIDNLNFYAPLYGPSTEHVLAGVPITGTNLAGLTISQVGTCAVVNHPPCAGIRLKGI